MDALPADIPLSVEAPAGKTHPDLGLPQRAARACAASREFLQSWRPVR
jgi:hypothetical protein